MQDRPSATELLAAVREFLERDVLPTVDGRVQFHTRVAINALGMVERELTLGPRLDALDGEALSALLATTGSPVELERELAARIRDGSLDDRRSEVLDHVRSSVRRKLDIANPRYLED